LLSLRALRLPLPSVPADAWQMRVVVVVGDPMVAVSAAAVVQAGPVVMVVARNATVVQVVMVQWEIRFLHERRALCRAYAAVKSCPVVLVSPQATQAPRREIELRERERQGEPALQWQPSPLVATHAAVAPKKCQYLTENNADKQSV
jgi:hypothetical protein